MAASTSDFPPAYNDVTGQHSSPGGGLTYVDFLPGCQKAGGIFSLPEFESFRVLVERANAWLNNYPQWEVKTCESVEFTTDRGAVDYEQLTYHLWSHGSTTYIRGFRLWLVPRTDPSRPPQQIGYCNYAPEVKSSGGFFGALFPTFETVNEVIGRFNENVHKNPLPGKIITIESQEMKLPSYKQLDPDKSCWSESAGFSKQFVFIIRIFFEITAPVIEQIGLADFLPNLITGTGIFKFIPDSEPFQSVVINASQWCASQIGVRFCNAQSLEIKIKSGHNIDSQNMYYVESGNMTTYYAKILRVAYAIPVNFGPDFMPCNRLQLTCKTFVPLQTSASLISPRFENLSATKLRVESWIRATGAKVVSAETISMRLYGGIDPWSGIEKTYNYSSPERSEYWILVIRLYLDGFYNEPPPHMLPPQPQITPAECCALL